MAKAKSTAVARTVPAATAEYGGLDYNTMTPDQLEAENNRLTALRDSIREEQKQLVLALDAKVIAKRMADKLASLSDPEREALTQLVSDAGGIQSEERFGNSGA